MTIRKTEANIPPGLFDTVDPLNFEEMLAAERYGTRSDVFDRLIVETHLHFWDPLDPAYLPLDAPFDLDQRMIVPMEMVPELRSAVADRLSAKQRIKFVNENVRWWLSSILHGEQGGLSLASSLCHLLYNPAAVEFAANQAREEARHVTAFARYIECRWGAPFPAGESMTALLADLVQAREVNKKIVGMQLLIEGLGMGVFSVLHRRCTDPALKRLTQLVMVDEAFHHLFGKIWSDCALPAMMPEERDAVEDWAASCFRVVVSNLMHPEQKRPVYEPFGLDWQWVRDAMREAYASKECRALAARDNEILHILVRSLLHAGIITKRTRHFYAVWLDLEALAAQPDDIEHREVVAEGINYLRNINQSPSNDRGGRSSAESVVRRAGGQSQDT